MARRYPPLRSTPSRITSLGSWRAGAGAVVPMGGPFFRIEVYQDALLTSPMDLSTDILGATGARLKYGINGNGPLDRVAGTGELHWTLKNDSRNSASLQGYYSPSHTNVRAGWSFGKYVRAIFTYEGVEYIKFTGKVRSIAPDAGRFGPRRVGVVAYDFIRDLSEANAREVTIQVDQSEDALLNALIAAVPASAQPVATDLDTGVDTYPYAFDNVSGNTKAYAVMRDVVVSSFGMLFQKGDGTLCYRTRHVLATTASSGSFNETMIGLSVPSTLDGVFDRARTTIHPKQISATATDELYTLPPGTSVEIPGGATNFEVWTDYTDPDNRQVNIGGTSVVTALVAGTHYVANTAADGSGLDLTASITAAIDAFGSTAKWTISNSHAGAVHLTTQKVIGKAVRDPGPQTFESPPSADGARPIDIDLPYQDDPYIGQSVSDYVVAIYSDLTQQVKSIEFIANASPALMLQALEREPGDVVTITETVTGLISVQALIQSVEFEAQQGSPAYIVCRWGLTQANTTNFWHWGIAGASEWGVSTVYGF